MSGRNKLGGADMLALKRESRGGSASKKAERKAQPVKGEVDLQALRQTLKAKFPKTIAHLAK